MQMNVFMNGKMLVGGGELLALTNRNTHISKAEQHGELVNIELEDRTNGIEITIQD